MQETSLWRTRCFPIWERDCFLRIPCELPCDGDSWAEDAEEVGGVVVKQDAGEDVLGGVVGDRLVEILRVGGWELVESDVLEARVEHCRVEEYKSHVAGGFGGDVARVDVGAGGKIVDGVDGVVDAEAHEGFTGELGTEFGEIEGAENGRLGVLSAGG